MRPRAAEPTLIVGLGDGRLWESRDQGDRWKALQVRGNRRGASTPSITPCANVEIPVGCVTPLAVSAERSPAAGQSGVGGFAAHLPPAKDPSMNRVDPPYQIGRGLLQPRDARSASHSASLEAVRAVKTRPAADRDRGSAARSGRRFPARRGRPRPRRFLVFPRRRLARAATLARRPRRRACRSNRRSSPSFGPTATPRDEDQRDLAVFCVAAVVAHGDLRRSIGIGSSVSSRLTGRARKDPGLHPGLRHSEPCVRLSSVRSTLSLVAGRTHRNENARERIGMTRGPAPRRM